LDPESGILYVKSTNSPAIAKIAKNAEKNEEVDADYSIARGREPYSTMAFRSSKPPYAHLTAIDLNKGEIVWRVPFGDDARLARIPRSKTWPCPKTRRPGSAGGVVTKGGLIFVGGGDTALHAASTADGSDLWKSENGPSRQLDPHDYRTAAAPDL